MLQAPRPNPLKRTSEPELIPKPRTETAPCTLPSFTIELPTTLPNRTAMYSSKSRSLRRPWSIWGTRVPSIPCDLDLQSLQHQLRRRRPEAVFNLVESLDWFRLARFCRAGAAGQDERALHRFADRGHLPDKPQTAGQAATEPGRTADAGLVRRIHRGRELRWRQAMPPVGPARRPICDQGGLGARLGRLGRTLVGHGDGRVRVAAPPAGIPQGPAASLFRGTVHRRTRIQHLAVGRRRRLPGSAPGRNRLLGLSRGKTPAGRLSSQVGPRPRSSSTTRRAGSVFRRKTARCCSGSASWPGPAGICSGWAAMCGWISASIPKASRGSWR